MVFIGFRKIINKFPITMPIRTIHFCELLMTNTTLSCARDLYITSCSDETLPQDFLVLIKIQSFDISHKRIIKMCNHAERHDYKQIFCKGTYINFPL